MPKTVFDADKAAKLLVEATMFGDAKAAEKFKVTPRTLRNYRKRLSEDTNPYFLPNIWQFSSVMTRAENS